MPEADRQDTSSQNAQLCAIKFFGPGFRTAWSKRSRSNDEFLQSFLVAVVWEEFYCFRELWTRKVFDSALSSNSRHFAHFVHLLGDIGTQYIVHQACDVFASAIVLGCDTFA